MLVGASPSRLYRNRFMKPTRAEDGSVVGGSTTASSTSEGQPSCPVEKIAGESITSLQGASFRRRSPGLPTPSAAVAVPVPPDPPPLSSPTQ
ncbi:hypothetical protein ACCO45_002558 [Purpureocillium lilacinum]|uniref:Uncharacterized protein n=1 Tax=Purpureocillium lilacinum TaxID=33203 RepID=A0ACC4EA86_PURLI